MAAVNLVPNPAVLVVQAGVFLVNLVLVKKLYVEPYLRVRDRREAMTVGSRDEAARALAECDTVAQALEARLNAAMTDAKKARDRVREAALTKRTDMLSAAEAEARQAVDAVERQIQQEVATERAKVPAVVASLTDEVYKLALA
jgi:F0F1-type ATP synthase membrane subunit b/b'